MNTTGELAWILDLTNHQMNDENAIELASHLKTNEKIKLLYLNANNITDKGLLSLAHSIKENIMLENLYFMNNKNTLEGIISLMKILLWRKKPVINIYIDLNTKLSSMKDRDYERLIKGMIDYKINHGPNSFYINATTYFITEDKILKKVKDHRTAIYDSLRKFIDDIAIDFIYQYLFDYQVKKLIAISNDVTSCSNLLHNVIY
jgi:hypothetical protein